MVLTMRGASDVLHGQPKIRLQDDFQVMMLLAREFKKSNILKSLFDIEN